MGDEQIPCTNLDIFGRFSLGTKHDTKSVKEFSKFETRSVKVLLLPLLVVEFKVEVLLFYAAATVLRGVLPLFRFFSHRCH